ncbi:hypothetical protein BHE74_00028957 [Ensete ventricosum]|nr:hypothetical protein BHE74_00028957 [Ensete ventricosum]
MVAVGEGNASGRGESNGWGSNGRGTTTVSIGGEEGRKRAVVTHYSDSRRLLVAMVGVDGGYKFVMENRGRTRPAMIVEEMVATMDVLQAIEG